MFRLRARAGVVLSVLALVGAPLFLLATTAEVAGAAEFLVDSPGDAGAGTLRQAIADAASAGTDDVITVAPGLGTITLTTGPINYVANGALTIIGNGVTVNGNGGDGIINETGGTGALSIDGMNFTGAAATDDEVSAVVAKQGDGNFSLSNCSFFANTMTATTSADVGPAVFIGGGNFTVNGCSFTGNTASGQQNLDIAGGIVSEGGPLSVTNSNFNGNSVSANANSVAAAAIDSEGGPLSITNTSITNNSATVSGGTGSDTGAVASEGGSLTIVNSTISGNTASAPVGQSFNTTGGLLIFATDSDSRVGLRMTYVTLTNNTGGPAGNVFLTAIVESFGTVVTGGGPNCFFDSGSMTSHGYNFTDDDSCGFADPTDKTGTDPGLQPLGDNGGPGLTQLPTLNGAVFDAIPPASCQADGAAGVTTDERGVTRPQFAGCDIGAVELAPVQEVVEVVPTLTG